MTGSAWRSPLVIGTVLLAAAAGSGTSPGDELLIRIESETNRRHTLLKEYTGSRQYTLQNSRFGKQAAASVLMSYHEPRGEQYTVVSRSGSDQLGSIIDRVLASEANASLPVEKARHEINSTNYRGHLLGTAVVAGRICHVLELTPRIKHRFLIVGKVWVDTASYAVVRIEGRFATKLSMLLGAPRIDEDFVEIQGFWLPRHVRSVTSSFLLGASELDVRFSDYRLERGTGPPGDPE
jgi:negative regulator of sigma E activity